MCGPRLLPDIATSDEPKRVPCASPIDQFGREAGLKAGPRAPNRKAGAQRKAAAERWAEP